MRFPKAVAGALAFGLLAGTAGAVELTKPGDVPVRARACAYESASDAPSAKNGCLFSIRF